MPILLCLLYTACHFLIFVLILRHLEVFSREAVIFLYHFLSIIFVMAAAILLLTIASVPHPIILFFGIVGLHGIYSLSFLEIWSLSQGGYSLSLLRHARESGHIKSNTDFLDMERIGDTKKSERIESLKNLSLVKEKREQLTLTNRGRYIAGMLALIAWLANERNDK